MCGRPAGGAQSSRRTTWAPSASADGDGLIRLVLLLARGFRAATARVHSPRLWRALYRLLRSRRAIGAAAALSRRPGGDVLDRKSTRLNSSHDQISYAVFCLKKKSNK